MSDLYIPPKDPITALVDSINNKPSYEDLINGFDKGGGTTTPSKPQIVSSSSINGLNTLFWTKQSNLTNLSYYELQVSDDDSTWYGLGTSRNDWKSIEDGITTTYSNFFVHKVSTKIDLYYRIRAITKNNSISDWSNSIIMADIILDEPDAPVLTMCQGSFKTIYVAWNKQADINVKQYEIQVSGEGTNWYKPRLDGVDWKSDLDEVLIWYDHLFVHPEISFLNDSGRPLFYRVRVVTEEGNTSEWSSIGSTSTQIVQQGEYYLHTEDYTFNASGILNLDGDADVIEYNQYENVDGQGVLYLVGDAEEMEAHRFSFDGDGGLEISGGSESDYTYNFNHSTTGNMILSGDAEEVEENNYYKTGSGSLKLSDSADVIASDFHFSHTSSGSLKMSGSATTEVSQSITFGSSSEFSTSGNTHNETLWLTDTKFVVVFAGVARIGTISGTTITWGSSTYTFNTQATFVGLDRIDDDTFIVSYSKSPGGNGICKIGSVTDYVISFGSEQTFVSATVNSTSVSMLTSTKLIVAYRLDSDDKPYVIHGDISSGSITWQSATKLSDNANTGSSYYQLKIVKTCENSNTSSFAVSWSDTRLRVTGGYVWKSTNSLELGTTVTIDGTQAIRSDHYDMIDAQVTGANDAPLLVTYYQSIDDKTYGVIIQTGGGSLTLSSNKVEILDDECHTISVTASTSELLKKSFIISYLDTSDSDKGKSVICNVATTTTWAAATPYLSDNVFTFNNATTYYTVKSDFMDKVVITYIDGSGENRAIVGSVKV